MHGLKRPEMQGGTVAGQADVQREKMEETKSCPTVVPNFDPER
jgi:hypothetical protein